MGRFEFIGVMVFVLFCGLLQGQENSAIRIDSLITTQPPQHIVWVSVSIDALDNYSSGIIVSPGTPYTNSQLGEKAGGVVSINGSFFNTKTFRMVTYYEEENKVRSSNVQSDKPSLFNGLVSIDHNGIPQIEFFKGEAYHEHSKAEKEALSSGPMLLYGGKKLPLPDRPAFVNKRHPRSCLCITEKELILLAADGRSSIAAGMTLPELQELLLNLGCTEAINLDGGGSTSLWVKEHGVINQPSDATGERKVVNSIVLIPKE